MWTDETIFIIKKQKLVHNEHSISSCYYFYYIIIITWQKGLFRSMGEKINDVLEEDGATGKIFGEVH